VLFVPVQFPVLNEEPKPCEIDWGDRQQGVSKLAWSGGTSRNCCLIGSEHEAPGLPSAPFRSPNRSCSVVLVVEKCQSELFVGTVCRDSNEDLGDPVGRNASDDSSFVRLAFESSPVASISFRS